MSVFRFKYFDVKQEKNPLKVGTDSMLLGALIIASGHERALDLGAGTGVLSLMIAQKNQTIEIEAIEIHEEGATECRENFVSSPWNNRLNVIQGDYFKFPFQGMYDLIYSNPPFHLDTFQSLDKDLNQAKHIALPDVSRFFKRVDSLLTNNGKCWITIPYSNLKLFFMKANENSLYPYHCVFIHANSTKLNKRVIVAFHREMKNKIIESEIVIRDNENSYSEEYKNLTKEFHWDLF